MSAGPSIIAQLGLNRSNFRTEAENTKRELGGLQTSARETAGAIALLERQFKSSSGTDAQKAQLKELTAHQRALQREIKATESQLRALAGAGGSGAGGSPSPGLLGRAGGWLMGAAGGLLGGLSVGGAVQGLKSLIGYAGELGDTSESLNLSTDAFQRLTYAFGQSGANSEDVTRGLGKLTESIAAARDGSVELEQAFANLGVSFRDLQTLPADELMKKISAGVRASTDSTATYADLRKVMGKGARRLLPGLKGEDFESQMAAAPLAEDDAVKAGKEAGDKLEALAARKKAASLNNLYALFRGGKDRGFYGVIGELGRMVAGGAPELGQPGAGVGGAITGAGTGGAVTGTGKDAGPPADKPSGKSPIQLKQDELRLAGDLLDIQRKGDDVAVASAQKRLDAAKELVENAKNDPSKTGLQRAELDLKVNAAAEELRVAQQASAEKTEQLRIEKEIADFRGSADARHLLALDLEAGKLRRRLADEKRGADKKAEDQVDLARNDLARKDALQAIAARNENTYLLRQQAGQGRGTSEAVRMIDERLTTNTFAIDRNKAGTGADGKFVPKDANLYAQQLNESAQLTRQKEDILLAEKQSLAATQSQVVQMGLLASGALESASAEKDRLFYAQAIETALHKQDTATAALIGQQERLNKLTKEAANFRKSPEQRKAEEDEKGTQALAMRTVTAREKTTYRQRLESDSSLSPGEVERMVNEKFPASSRPDTHAAEAAGNVDRRSDLLGSLRANQKYGSGAYDPGVEGDYRDAMYFGPGSYNPEVEGDFSYPAAYNPEVESDIRGKIDAPAQVGDGDMSGGGESDFNSEGIISAIEALGEKFDLKSAN